MPRYFFHVIDGKIMLDDQGIEFPDNPALVRREAIKSAASMLSDLQGEEWSKGREWTMLVADEEGNVVMRLRFSAE